MTDTGLIEDAWTLNENCRSFLTRFSIIPGIIVKKKNVLVKIVLKITKDLAKVLSYVHTVQSVDSQVLLGKGENVKMYTSVQPLFCLSISYKCP